MGTDLDASPRRLWPKNEHQPFGTRRASVFEALEATKAQFKQMVALMSFPERRKKQLKTCSMISLDTDYS
jgi:hypothetical protein